MDIKKTRNLKVTLSVVAVVLLVSIVGVTSAYFVAGFLGDTTTDVTVTTGSVAGLTFAKDGDLVIAATSENFYAGNGSISSTVNTSATLESDEATTAYYGMYFNVELNEFTYSTEEEYPELLLKVIGSDNNEITSIDGLVYKTYGDSSGFDVTTITEGMYTLLDNVAITTDGSTPSMQEYTVTLTFVNLDTNQNNNSNKVFDAQVIMGDGISSGGGSGSQSNAGELILTSSGESLEDIVAKGEPDFGSSVETGIYATEDYYGTTYYYRGAVDNNWLKFGQENGQDIWWRITRINGDGTIRIIYSGTTAPDASQSVVMTGPETQIATSAFNSNYNSAEYTGYMYTIGENHGIGTGSTIKGVIDTWYENNLSSYSEYISQNTSFCYNRTAYADEYGDYLVSGTGTNTQYFKSHVNLVRNKTPILTCDNINDYYTTDEADNGNNALNSPIGLMSADEAALAGSVYSNSNSWYYLYTKSTFWLGSPFNFDNNEALALAFSVYSFGELYHYVAYNSLGVRVVVSLIRDINITGSGSYSDPYVVQMQN